MFLYIYILEGETVRYALLILKQNRKHDDFKMV